MKLNSLAFRLFVTSAAWTLFVLPLAGFLIYSLYRDDVQASFDGQLRKLVTAINIDSMESGSDTPVAPTNRYEPLFEVTNSGWYWQIKPLDTADERKLVSASLATATLPSPVEENLDSDEGGARWMNIAGPTGEPLRIVEVVDTLGHELDKPRYSIVVAGPLDWLDATVANFRNRLSVALTLAGLALVGLTLIQVRFGLLPLRRVERGLAAIRSGDAAQLKGELPVEIEPLKQEINALIQSNQDIVDRARTQVGNLAHALKTPLAVITNEARDDDTRFSNKVSEQATIMRDQVSHYLDRARMAARVNVIGRVTPIRPVVEPLVRALERIHRDRGIKIHVSCPEAIKFQGEKHDLEEMLGNLMDNACKWAHTKVWLTVTPEASADKKGNLPSTGRNFVRLTVEDDGNGLTSEQRQKIGKRGLRLDETKPGSGLGMSIVVDLAQSYQGGLELDASRHGGLSAQLRLPAV